MTGEGLATESLIALDFGPDDRLESGANVVRRKVKIPVGAGSPMRSACMQCEVRPEVVLSYPAMLDGMTNEYSYLGRYQACEVNS